MIDIHCHILADVDDGAKTMEDSVAMAKAAVAQGIDQLVATPHHQNGRYINDKASIIAKVKSLNHRLQEEAIPLTILPGQETRIHGEMVNNLAQGQLLSLNETSGYLFVELPSDHVPRYTKQLLFDIQVQGYTPIIVHPERNRQLMEQPNRLYEFVKTGTLTQVTAASVCGKFGKKIKKFSHELIEANLTHFVASDAHNTTTRGFCMGEANEEISQVFGNAALYELMENAQRLVAGELVVGNAPEPVKKKKFLGLF